MKSNYLFLILTLTGLMVLSCTSEQDLAPIAKEYLIEKGNNVSSVTIKPSKAEGYYECSASTLDLVDNYSVNEIWFISFKDGKVISAVKSAPKDSTILTKLDSGEQITLKEYYQSVMTDMMQEFYDNELWKIGKVYSLSEMYPLEIGDDHLSCYDAVISLCPRSRKKEDKKWEAFEWIGHAIICLYGYSIDSVSFIDRPANNSLIKNYSTNEEYTYQNYLNTRYK